VSDKVSQYPSATAGEKNKVLDLMTLYSTCIDFSIVWACADFAIRRFRRAPLYLRVRMESGDENEGH